ncbi:MAG: aryl-sulfate sulfotransferase [Mailhella sp.]|nr:aryl-sulfate sulfotransferase [Mailhella sp.]
MKFLSGTVHYEPDRCFNGYTLWSPLATVMEGAEKPWQTHGITYLMTMRGDIVHHWDLPFPTFYSYLLPDGHLLAGMRTTECAPMRPGIPPHGMGGTMGILAELDWEGNIVFLHKDLSFHHDFKKLPGGNYIYLAWELLDPAVSSKVRGGIAGTEHADGAMWSDVYREIDRTGNVVWEWHAKDHLDVDRDIIGCIHTREEWSHINDLWVCPDGSILSSCRHLDAVIRVDRASGDITWKWGSPSSLVRGDIHTAPTAVTLGGPHDAHIIPDGLPGAGHMLCYDNGMFRYISRALEVDMETGSVVWESSKEKGYVHGRVPFSAFISGARRQPNGNTVICEGGNSHFYEVTPEQDVVWEYWRPEPDSTSTPWPVFRCFRYAPDFCRQFRSLPDAEGQAIL